MLNIDGAISQGGSATHNSNSNTSNAGNSVVATSNSTSSKYKSSSSDRAVSGVGRGTATFQTLATSDMEDGNATGNDNANNPLTADRVSVLSGASGRSKTTSQLEAAAKLPWYRGVTCKDIRDIMPTVLILIGGLLIMIFVIPYAFSSVIKQLEAEELLEKAREEAKRVKEEAANAAAEAEKAAEEAAQSTTSVMPATNIDSGEVPLPSSSLLISSLTSDLPDRNAQLLY